MTALNLNDFLLDLDNGNEQEDNYDVTEAEATVSPKPAPSQSGFIHPSSDGVNTHSSPGGVNTLPAKGDGLTFDDIPNPNEEMHTMNATAQSVSDFQSVAEVQEPTKRKRKVPNSKFELLNFDFSKDNPSVELTVKARPKTDADFKEVTKKSTDFKTIAADLGGKAVAAIFYAGLNQIAKSATKGLNPDQMLPAVASELEKLKKGDFTAIEGKPRTAGGKPTTPIEIKAVAKAFGVSIAKASEFWKNKWNDAQKQEILTQSTLSNGKPNPVPAMYNAMKAQEATATGEAALEDFF